jgi:hypothetical protein
MNTTPLSPDEYDKLFTMLELISSRISTNIARLLNQGVVMDESLDDERIHSSQRKIEKYRQSVGRERDRLKRIRDYLHRKKDQDRKRKNTSDH